MYYLWQDLNKVINNWVQITNQFEFTNPCMVFTGKNRILNL